ncbi:SUKH-3 domain-containing protein [Bradyrhizobium prioriisuperbiae]|uniref:SUKH-3 domain-containing protein n=1 Tax=Bradyrhizobium prioriisuperbiae TaxID=2854389 RepID=UPI0028E56724|nr:SUKH-3 domain-containing protein [Bradyrhizobium prioritasuperba]
MIEVPASARPLFVAAGWRPGRRTAAAPDVRHDHPAAAVLAELGGLLVGHLTFQPLPPDDLIFDVWEKLLSTQLVGVAETRHGYAGLYMDSSGRCFGHTIVDDGFYFEGASFGEAIEGLLLGRRSRPMLRPEQSTVWCYGEEIRADDPRVYRYR